MRRQTQTIHPFRSFIYSFPTQQDCVLFIQTKIFLLSAERPRYEFSASVLLNRICKGETEVNCSFFILFVTLFTLSLLSKIVCSLWSGFLYIVWPSVLRFNNSVLTFNPF